MMDAWFGEILGERDLPHDRIAIAGRLSLLLATARNNGRTRFSTCSISRRTSCG